MTTKLLTLLSLFLSFSVCAQVGVYTRNPQVSMEIKTTNDAKFWRVIPNEYNIKALTISQR